MYQSHEVRLILIRFSKELSDIDIIDDGVKSISYFKNTDWTHFIYCGEYYAHSGQDYTRLGNTRHIKEILSSKMRKYGVESSIFTMLLMQRQNLVTNEKTKLYYN